jgi:hypothetical protein
MSRPFWNSIPEDAPERIIAVELTRHDPNHTPGLGWALKIDQALCVIRALRDAGYVMTKPEKREPTP